MRKLANVTISWQVISAIRRDGAHRPAQQAQSALEGDGEPLQPAHQEAVGVAGVEEEVGVAVRSPIR